MLGSMYPRLRALTIGAATLALCALAAFLMLGSTAHADGDLRLDTRQPMAPHAIARFNEARVTALYARAPAAARGRCTTTIEVPGQGSSCRLPGGMWGVKLADGTTGSTHGPDVLADSVPVVDPAAGLGLSDAGNITNFPNDSAFVACATNASTPHYTAVYARHGGANPADAAAVKVSIRAALRQASEFVRLQSIADGAAPGSTAARLRFACDASGTIDVRQADIPDVPDIDFDGLMEAIAATPVNAVFTATSRVVAFTDLDNSYGAAGQGLLYNDDRALSSNRNNGSDLFAAHYLVSSPATPTAEWDVFLHEMFHNFGATQDGAPDANREGHCTDDADIMCYDEPASPGNSLATNPSPSYPYGWVYTHSDCPNTELDCGSDTYFNGDPALTGPSWIATHWNAGAPINKWIDHGSRNLDLTAPQVPGSARATAVTSTTATVAWDPVEDDFPAAVSYRLHVRPSGAATTIVEAGPSITSTLTGFKPGATVNVRIDARDAAGNVSLRGPETSIALPGDGTAVTGGGVVDAQPKAGAAPGRPSFPVISNLAGHTARITWKRAERGGAVVSWRVRTQPVGGRPSSVYVPATDLSAIVAVVPGVPTTVFVDAVNDAGTTTSLATRVVGRTAGSTCTWSERDTTAPRKPSGLRVSSRGRTKVVLRFRPATDRSICGYQTVRLVRGTWRAVGAPLAFAARVAAFTGLTRNAAQQLGIRSIDASGNVSATVKVIARTTR